MKNINREKLKSVLKQWDLGNCFRQFIVVVAGIIVTFWGSDMIAERVKQREISSIMQLIENEMETNRTIVEEARDRWLREGNMGKMLIESDYDCQNIPKDTLVKYYDLFNWTSSFNYVSDAIDVLKNSSLMQQMDDKVLLLNITQSYDALRNLKSEVDFYYQTKLNMMLPLFSSLSKEEQKALLDGDIRRIYSTFLKNESMQYLCLFSRGAIDINQFAKTIHLLDRNIDILKKRYNKQ